MPTNRPNGLETRLYLFCATLILAMSALAVTVWVLLNAEAQHAQDVVSDRVPQLQRISSEQ